MFTFVSVATTRKQLLLKRKKRKHIELRFDHNEIMKYFVEISYILIHHFATCQQVFTQYANKP